MDIRTIIEIAGLVITVVTLYTRFVYKMAKLESEYRKMKRDLDALMDFHVRRGQAEALQHGDLRRKRKY